jgi:hypothetical protein
MKRETITVKVSKRNTLDGSHYARKFGGKYDPKSQTWEIPANRPEIVDLAAYYLVRVDKPKSVETDDTYDPTDDEDQS